MANGMLIFDPADCIYPECNIEDGFGTRGCVRSCPLLKERLEVSMDINDEDQICERTLQRLLEHAGALGFSLEQVLDDVLPDTRKRLTAYMGRKSLAAVSPEDLAEGHRIKNEALNKTRMPK